MADAKLTKEFPTQRDRFGCYLGVGVGGLDSIHDATRTFDTKGGRALGPLLLPKMLANEAPAWLCMEHNLQGPMLATTNACASGSDAIGLAFQKIRDGYADYMLAGGTESCVTGPSFAGFANMRALSSWQGDAAGASRPFSGDRTGFVMAEGAGVLVLERLDLAEARGAKIYAEVVGYGATCDAFHFTAIHPEGRGGKLAIRHALDDAGVKPEDIGYINAHGTGTPMNDAAETLICKAVFGEHVSAGKEGHCVISSSKSMTGHMLGAAGGVEAAVAALALHEGVVPPTINLDTPDPACDLDYVPHVKRDVHAEYAMSTSFGFGGGNAALIIKKY